MQIGQISRPIEAGTTLFRPDVFGGISLEEPSPTSRDRSPTTGERFPGAFKSSAVGSIFVGYVSVASESSCGLAKITGGSRGTLSSADCILFTPKIFIGVCLSGSLFRSVAAGVVGWVPNFTIGKVSRIARVNPLARLCGAPFSPVCALGPYLSGLRIALIA